MANDKTILSETLCNLQKLSPHRLSPHLEALLQHSIVYEEKLTKLCWEIYRCTDNLEELEQRLTELSDAGELYCMRRRTILDSMYGTTAANYARTGVTFPQKADISQDIQISHDALTNTLRLVMPELLPFKGKWSVYLPDKIRCALEKFEQEYQHRGGGKLKISPAFVLFIHHYGEEARARSLYRDYDNQEYSCVLNALHSTQIFNDSAATFINTQMAVPDDRSFTEIVITEVKRMLEVVNALDLSLYTDSQYKRQNGSP